eukprot:g5733.t1
MPPGSGRISNQAPTTSSLPAASPTRAVTSAPGGGVRAEKPNYDLWNLPDLRKEAIRQAGKRKGLKFGPMMEDEVKQLSNANRRDLSAALTKRMEWREGLGVEPEWTDTPIGVTPEKRKKQQAERTAKAKKKAGRGHEGQQKGRGFTKHQGYCCRLACLTVLDEFYGEYLRSNGGGEGVVRGEQDSGEVNGRHRFYRLVAKAMATGEWKNEHVNPLSVPDDHSNDERAPPKLKSLLRDLDLEGAALSLRGEVATVFAGDEEAFQVDLQQRCYKWLKEIRSHHTAFKANETQSGGVGADEEDGEPVDAKHSFNFMYGRLPTMIWEDGIRLVAGGDDTNPMGSVIIADGQPGAGSSVPGGPGVRGSPDSNAAPSSGASKSGTSCSGETISGKPKSGTKKKQKTNEQTRDKLFAKAHTVMDKLSRSVDGEATGAGSPFTPVQADRAKDRVVEELIDDVERLEEKVASARSEKARQRYQALMEKAEARLDAVEAKADAEGAAAAASSTAGTSPTASLCAAQSAAVGGGGRCSGGSVEPSPA